MADGSSFCTVSALVHKSINTNMIACEKISDGEKYFNKKFLSKFLPLSCTKWTLRPQVSYCNYFSQDMLGNDLINDMFMLHFILISLKMQIKTYTNSFYQI